MSSQMTLSLLNKKYAKTLTFLQQWQDQSHLHCFYGFHNMELHDLEDITEEFLAGQWDADMTKYFDDKLYAFAVDGSGGYYAFWVYPELDKEAPIVYLDSHGGYAYVSDSFELYFKNFLKDVRSKELDEYEYKLESSVESYEDDNNVELDGHQIEDMLARDLALFEDKMNQFIGLDKISDEPVSHLRFDLWWSKVLIKSSELYFLKGELNDTMQLPKMLRILNNLIYTDSEPLDKSNVIKAFKENNPKFYDTELFQQWAKVEATADDKDTVYIESVEYTLRATIKNYPEHFGSNGIRYVIKDIGEKDIKKKTLIDILDKIKVKFDKNTPSYIFITDTVNLMNGLVIPQKGTEEYGFFEFFNK